MTPSYDLTTQPWIPCLRPDGTRVEVGLRESIVHAHEYQGLYDDSPPVVASLYRLLLALLHRVYGPEDLAGWRAIWEAGRFDPKPLDAYLDEWRDRFDLFHPEHPFYQAADERVTSKSIATLIFELASGNNATLFDHSTDDSPPGADPALAARLVVTAQSFGIAGLSGIPRNNFTDGTCTRGVLYLAEGDNLFQTTVLNLPPPRWRLQVGEDLREDRPAWEMDDPTQPDRSIPLGYLDYLTWRNRNVRLFPEQQAAQSIVRDMTVAPALRMDPALATQDPMKLYRIDKQRGPLVQRFNEDRALWRDSAVLLRLNDKDHGVPLVFHWLEEITGRFLPAGTTVGYMALGMAANQAKVDFQRAEHLPLPLAYLDNRELVLHLSNALQAAEEVGAALRSAANRVARLILEPDEHSGKSPDRDALANLRAQLAIDRRYWSRLETPFRQTMLAIPEHEVEALRQWYETLRQTAWRAFDQVADGLGDGARALKAVVKAREQLARDLGATLKFEE